MLVVAVVRFYAAGVYRVVANVVVRKPSTVGRCARVGLPNMAWIRPNSGRGRPIWCRCRPSWTRCRPDSIKIRLAQWALLGQFWTVFDQCGPDLGKCPINASPGRGHEVRKAACCCGDADTRRMDFGLAPAPTPCPSSLTLLIVRHPLLPRCASPSPSPGAGSRHVRTRDICCGFLS